MADETTATIQTQIKDLEKEYEKAEDAEEKLAIMSEMRRLWKIILDRTDHGPTDKHEHEDVTEGEGGFGSTIILDSEYVDDE
jgi:hypothetical protein